MIDWSKPIECDDYGTWRPARLLGETDSPSRPMVVAVRWRDGKEVVCTYSRDSASIRNVPPPKVWRKGWLNLYPNGDGFLYDTREDADEAADPHRCECREITWEVEDAR